MAPTGSSHTRRLKMGISLSVLENLGIGLYTNVPSVLSEIVANCWDADAELVEVEINPDARRIVVIDDGTGMTRDEVIDRFLMVGYKKRDDEGFVTDMKRHVMGRKGIGKLSAFSIAEAVEVHTIKNGERTAFRMTRNDIKEAIKEAKKKKKSEEYYPVELPEDVVDFSKGLTRIGQPQHK